MTYPSLEALEPLPEVCQLRGCDENDVQLLNDNARELEILMVTRQEGDEPYKGACVPRIFQDSLQMSDIFSLCSDSDIIGE